MPEAPEVQALVEFLDERMSGHAFIAIDRIDRRIVKTRDRPRAASSARASARSDDSASTQASRPTRDG